MSKVVLIGSVSLLVVMLIAVGVVLYLRSQQSASPAPAGTPPAGTPPAGTPPASSGCATNASCPAATPICVIPSGDTKGACKECGSTADCGVNKKCARGKCIDELKCYYNEDCTAAGKTKCLLPSGGTLGTTLGTCVECNTNANCPTGKVCYNGVCTLIADVPPINCMTNADCANDPKGQTKCLIPSGNLTGSCKTCAVDGDCSNPAAKRCGPDGMCYGCLNDANCQANFVCQNPGTSTAVCVEKGCTSNGDCSSGEVCAYPGTTFAKCVTTCNTAADCTEAGLRNCWGYENGAITQYKFKSGGPNYCVSSGPQKCCWNRFIQGCTSNGDCDGGGEGCVNNGDVTQQYGKATCNTCQSQGLVVNAAKDGCVKPYSVYPGVATVGNNAFTQLTVNSTDECGTACLNDPDCTHFVYRKNDKQCFKKKPNEPNANFDMYFKQENGAAYTHMDGWAMYGGDIDNKGANAQNCRDVCNNYGKFCYGYLTYKPDPNQCYIKGNFTDANIDTGTVTRPDSKSY